MKKIFLVSLVAIISVDLVGCAHRPGDPASSSCSILGPKTAIGILGGAVAGAGLGAAAGRGDGKAVLIGALVGAVIGSFVGNSLDQADCEHARLALQQFNTAQVGQHIGWANDQSGNSGTLTPLSVASTNSNGQVCRQYKRDVVMKNGQQTGGDIGVACRDANGDWSAVS